MPAEATIYARLSSDSNLNALVGDRINPTNVPVNEQLAYLSYMVQGSETGMYLNGQPSSLNRYTIGIDVYARDAAPVHNILDALKTLLNGWRGAGVQYCRWDGHNTSREETGHHGTATYTLWVTES